MWLLANLEADTPTPSTTGLCGTVASYVATYNMDYIVKGN